MLEWHACCVQEQALIATQQVEGIVKLVETVMCGHTKWLIMEPLGVELPNSPASVVSRTCTSWFHASNGLHAVGWMHCDISYSNCVVFQPEGKAGFIDMGAAKTIKQVRVR